MKRPFVTAAAIAFSAGIAPTALAQCDFWVPYVPDFDQKRSGGSGIPALPASGGMYCVPTSVTNWFAYFANRGISQPLTLDGPRTWQSNSNYNRVTSTLSTMGSLMGTDPVDGTNGNGGLSGAFIYSLAYAQGRVVVNHYWCGGGYCPTPSRIAFKRALGGYVAACYGYYNESPANAFTRSGGHCITVNGEVNVCSGTPYLQFRDPADDGANTTQSTFTTRAATMSPIAGLFRGKAGQAFTFDLRYRLNYGSSLKFLDGWYVLDPIVGLTGSAIDSGSLTLLRPFRFNDSSLPAVQNFATPAGTGPVRAMCMHPELTDYYYITAPLVVGIQARLYRLDPVGGASTQLLSGDLRLLAFSRHGELYTCDGSVMKQYNIDTNPPTLLASVTLPAIPECIAYDDDGDSVAVITPTGVTTRKLLSRYTRNLGGSVGGGGFIPSTAVPVGQSSIAFGNDTSTIFVCGTEAAAIYKLSSLTDTLTHADTITLPVGTQPTGLNVADSGHVLCVGGGVIHEFLKPAAGGPWIADPSSIFAGLPAGSEFFLARSRTNHVPSLHEGPEWVNIANPEIAPGIPDCYANCDGSTNPPVLNVNDFSCFLNLFAAARIEANCDESTTPPLLNVNDFQCFLNRYAQGCP